MTPSDVKEVIKKSVSDAEVHIMDPMNDGQHLQAIVISPLFDALSLVEQHRMVMNPLKAALKETVHALGLKTFTPEKWANEKDQYEL